MRRVALLIVCLCASALAGPSVASAQEALIVSINTRDTDYSWTGEPAKVTGRATLTDGQAAQGRVLTVESRPYPYTGPWVAEPIPILSGTDGRFTYERRPTKNVQIRIRGDAGQASPILTLRVFALAQEGDLKALKKGRYRATETSIVPEGFKIGRAYLYFCKPKAKKCTYAAKGKARVKGQRLSASATFKPPRKYAARKYKVFFRYVPKAGWGDSNRSELSKPKKTLAADDS